MPNASWRRWGVATARGGGSPILETRAKRQVERTQRSGGLHKRSAEAWGHPLRARGAKLPLGAFAVAFREIRPVLRASSDGERELAPQRATSPRNHPKTPLVRVLSQMLLARGIFICTQQTPLPISYVIPPPGFVLDRVHCDCLQVPLAADTSGRWIVVRRARRWNGDFWQAGTAGSAGRFSKF
jgi:hypothetical protein